MDSDPTRPSDRQLIDDIRAGGILRERALLRFTGDVQIKGFITGIVNKHPATRNDGELLLEETAGTFIEKITADEFVQTASLRTFFIGIAKNKWLNLRKQRLRQIRNNPLLPYDPDLLLHNPGAQSDPWLESEDARQKHWENIINNHFKIRELCKKIILMQLQGYSNEEIQTQVAVTDIYRERYRCFRQFRDFTNDNPGLFEALKN